MKAIRKNSRIETIQYNIFEHEHELKIEEQNYKDHIKKMRKCATEMHKHSTKIFELKQLLKTKKLTSTGIKDAKGNLIHIGDTINLDRTEIIKNHVILRPGSTK